MRSVSSSGGYGRRTPDTDFIPPGFVPLIDGVTLIGKAVFGTAWTGQELYALGGRRYLPRAAADISNGYEAQERLNEAWTHLRKYLYSGTIGAVALDSHGRTREIPGERWAAADATSILAKGRVTWTIWSAYGGGADVGGRALVHERSLLYHVALMSAAQDSGPAEPTSPAQSADLETERAADGTMACASGRRSNHRVPIYSEAEVRAWFKSYIAESIEAGRKPSRDDDLKAANERFGRIPRACVRSLRKELAPPEWQTKGKRRQLAV